MRSALRIFVTIASLATAYLQCGALSARAEQISVFAAASLQNVMAEVITEFEAGTKHGVVASYAGSSVVARQVEYGAPADVVMLANANWIEFLSTRGYLQSGSVKRSYGNGLSLVVPVDSKLTSVSEDFSELSQILKADRIAMALVEAVPAGIYGKEALMSLGVWNRVKAGVVETDNVRVALALVALGEVAAGIVYTTDAQVENRVRIAAQFPPESHSQIVYPAAIVNGRDRPEVVEFLEFLDSQVAKKAFVRHGFSILDDAQ